MHINGYKVADDINFEVKNGKVLIDGKEASKDGESYIISVEDEAIGQTYIFFSKQDILGDELKGDSLQIVDTKTDKVIEEWVSDGSTTTFKLSEGSYKLVETAAPKGYKNATEINFSVDKDGKVTADVGSLKTSTSNNVIVLVDDYKESKIFFSKQDILGKELPGAKLKIKEKETGKVVQEWTSGDTPSTFGLKPGKYVFVETAAPKGYKIATAIDFEITVEGEIKADTKSLKTVGDKKILVMVDDCEDKKEDGPKKPADKTKPNEGRSDDKDSGKKESDLKTSDEKEKDKTKDKEDKPSERKTDDSKLKTKTTKENKDKTDKSYVKDKDISKETLTRSDDYGKSKDTSRKGYNYSPKTGVSTNIGFYLATIALSGVAPAFISKKNKIN